MDILKNDLRSLCNYFLLDVQRKNSRNEIEDLSMDIFEIVSDFIRIIKLFKDKLFEYIEKYYQSEIKDIKKEFSSKNTNFRKIKRKK